jgi:hypothetical protein
LQAHAKRSLYYKTKRSKLSYAEVVRQAEVKRQWRMALSEEGKAKIAESRKKYEGTEKGQQAKERSLERKKTPHSKAVAAATHRKRKLVGFFGQNKQGKRCWVQGTGLNPLPDPRL